MGDRRGEGCQAARGGELGGVQGDGRLDSHSVQGSRSLGTDASTPRDSRRFVNFKSVVPSDNAK